MAKHYIYRFKAELQDYKPKIWRTFEIDGGKTMAELGYILQIMFEMQASHLFCFRDNVGERFQEYMREHFTEEELLKFSKKNDALKRPNWYRYEITNDGDAICLFYHGDNFFGDVRPLVHHRQQYPADCKVGVYVPPCLCYTFEQQF
jgi:hypothetical protein